MTKERWAVKFIRAGFKIVFWILTRTSYSGGEHIPASGPFLVVTNHLSYADAPFIMLGIERPNMVVLAADTYRSNTFFRWLVAEVGGVWIHRGSGDRGAVKAAMETLKTGHILGMAPEGTRSRVTHALQTAKSGVAFIASKSGVPILPVGLSGTDKIFSELRRFRRADIRFTAGPVFTLPSLDGSANKSATLDGYTREVMCRIAALLPEHYHGVYAGDPRIAEIQAAQQGKGAGAA
jgi:1-acyl-sn-glycerol-3-phosphate acyltransferase